MFRNSASFQNSNSIKILFSNSLRFCGYLVGYAQTDSRKTWELCGHLFSSHKIFINILPYSVDIIIMLFVHSTSSPSPPGGEKSKFFKWKPKLHISTIRHFYRTRSGCKNNVSRIQPKLRSFKDNKIMRKKLFSFSRNFLILKIQILRLSQDFQKVQNFHKIFKKFKIFTRFSKSSKFSQDFQKVQNFHNIFKEFKICNFSHDLKKTFKIWTFPQDFQNCSKIFTRFSKLFKNKIIQFLLHLFTKIDFFFLIFQLAFFSKVFDTFVKI